MKGPLNVGFVESKKDSTTKKSWKNEVHPVCLVVCGPDGPKAPLPGAKKFSSRGEDFFFLCPDGGSQLIASWTVNDVTKLDALLSVFNRSFGSAKLPVLIFNGIHQNNDFAVGLFNNVSNKPYCSPLVVMSQNAANLPDYLNSLVKDAVVAQPKSFALEGRFCMVRHASPIECLGAIYGLFREIGKIFVGSTDEVFFSCEDMAFPFFLQCLTSLGLLQAQVELVSEINILNGCWWNPTTKEVGGDWEVYLKDFRESDRESLFELLEVLQKNYGPKIAAAESVSKKAKVIDIVDASESESEKKKINQHWFDKAFVQIAKNNLKLNRYERIEKNLSSIF